MAKRKNTTKKLTTKRAADDAVIALCVEYAQCVAAIQAGYEADPDGDFKFADGPAEANFRKRRKRALDGIGRHKTTTADGLSAKARIVPMIVKDNEGLSL